MPTTLTMPQRLDATPHGTSSHEANGHADNSDSPPTIPMVATEAGQDDAEQSPEASTPNDEFDHADDANSDFPPPASESEPVDPLLQPGEGFDPDEGRPVADDWFRNQFNCIYNAELSCIRAESQVEVLKLNLKKAKETLDERIIKLRGLCREMEKEKEKDYPLFGQQPASGATTSEAASAAPEAATSEVAPTPTGPPPDDESWRKVELEHLEITEAVLSALYNCDMSTVGDLSNYLQDHKATEIEGVGKAKAVKIGEALETFWAERNKAGEAGVVEVESTETETTEG